MVIDDGDGKMHLVNSNDGAERNGLVNLLLSSYVDVGMYAVDNLSPCRVDLHLAR